MPEILMPVPIAIAETNGSLKSGNKSLLLEILLKNGDINGLIDFNDRAGKGTLRYSITLLIGYADFDFFSCS
jgi:hypothetical protein